MLIVIINSYYYYYYSSDPPRYDPTLSTYRVIEGSSPQLLLQLSAFPDVTQYTWRKDGIIIQSDNRITLLVNGLIFNGISISDSGQYTVTTSDQQGQATIIVVVYRKYNYINISMVILFVSLPNYITSVSKIPYTHLMIIVN